MKQFLFKGITEKALDVDTGTRAVKIVLSRMGNLDRDKDVIAPGAFNKTIAERGPTGTNEIWAIANHATWAGFDNAMGKFKELYVEQDKLIGIVDYKDTPIWAKVWPLYESGDINQHSIGFSIMDSDYKEDGTRIIKQISLWEGGPQLWGANADTPTEEVIKSAPARIEALYKSLNKPDFDKSLFNIELMQLKDLMEVLETKATQPPTSIEPTVKKINWGMVAALINV